MDEEGLNKELKELRERIDMLDRELRLMQDPDQISDPTRNLVELQGGFFQMISALKSLYLDQEEDQAKILKISRDIEMGRIKVDMAELFFRFFLRQEIQNSRMKLLFLSQKYDVDPSLFDQLDDLSVLIDDHRYSVQQVIIGWKRFEKNASTEIRRLQQSGNGKKVK
jgi:hypothetical protein